MHLAGLFMYPVKALHGCALRSAEVDALGIVGDRRFMVVDEQGKFMTQRTLPRMALIETSFEGNELVLCADGHGAVKVPREAPPDKPSPSLRTVSVWKTEGIQAEDCGDWPAEWIGDFLKCTCRLVRIGPAYRRPIRPEKLPPGMAGVVSFADAYPFLAIGQASLDDLNDRLTERREEPMPMNRFRPNFVIAGSAPYEEDDLGRFRIGEMIFRTAGACARCVVTTTNQETAERGIEPLRTLADYRRDPLKPNNVNFGQNLIHETKAGTVRPMSPIERLPNVAPVR